MTTYSSLFVPVQARRDIQRELSDQLTLAVASVAESSASPTIDLAQFRQELAAKTFEKPEDLKALLDWTVQSLSHGLVHMTHPRYFGLFNPAPAFPAECADAIVAAFNPQICAWSHAPVAVEIEAHMIARLAGRIGFPAEAGGHFTSGGSEANNTSVICALTEVEPDFAERGARAFSGQPRLYVSAESHLAWLKIAHASGIGRCAVRLVATDGMGRMDAKALQACIEKDLSQGDIPFMIAATAGTTNAGMVDPLHACADLAKRFDLWFHVDAAWGGALVVSEKYRSVLDGIERANSVTIDAHKWFASTMGAGIFITRQRAVLNRAFRVVASYMPSNNIEVDYYVNSMQWSRRFIGLRLFLSLAVAGWEGYAMHVEKGIALIDRLSSTMQKKGWSVVNASRMAVVCLVPPEGGERVEACVERVVEQGDAWVSLAQFEGKGVIRVCVTHGGTEESDLDFLVGALVGGPKD